ncbi:hypothetical protein [Enterococcus sp. CR-Ec1]|uniref:hypothetical protein n=1 Tax=Enterococcus sp. CR-Ec1 TaxID=2057791 RepID=UPI0018F51D8C|nr:hypothetical protein [Enterococcus sp. CR-Ec1]
MKFFKNLNNKVDDNIIETYDSNKRNLFEKSVENNLTGRELEKSGKIDEAIELYERNVSDRFEGNYPYDRLAIIYRKRRDYDNEIRVLRTAVEVFENNQSMRKDISPKIDRFKKRLDTANKLKQK